MRAPSRKTGNGKRKTSQDGTRSVPVSRFSFPGPGSSSFRLRLHSLQLPPLLLRHRPRLLDADAVADLRGLLLVVRQEAARALDGPLVASLLHAALDLDDDRLVHLVRDHAADLRLPPMGLGAVSGRPGFCFHHSFSASSSARWYVRTRAMSRRITLRRLGFSSWPVAFWRRSFHAASCSCFAFSASSWGP